MTSARAGRNRLPAGYLHTSGTDIVAADGRPVRLAGVNWYGFECESMVPGGLDANTIDEMCWLIADLGFNHVRLPYCGELVLRNPRISNGLAAMPALRGARALDVMDAVVDSAGRNGVKIVMDNHRSDAGWSAQGNGLWYSPGFSPRQWRESLTLVARRYLGNDTVVGIDLRNEPGSPPTDETEHPRNGGAVWGEPDRRWTRRPRDWAAAAERAGNEVLACNPDLLIVVEGVRADPAGPTLGGATHLYWPGGNLIGVQHEGGRRKGARPIALSVPGRLVYSVHDYGPVMHPQMQWCQPGTTALTPDACRSVWEQTWGFIVRRGIAPLYVGEFGTPNDFSPEHTAVGGPDTRAQRSWFTYLVDYIRELGASWAYWPLNGMNCLGGGRDPGQPDSFGLLKPDYSGPSSPSIMAELATIQGPPAAG